jgi:hypothetical protein
MDAGQVDPLTGLVDITARSSQMPPDSGILYPSSETRPSKCVGVIRITQSRLYWVTVQTRTVHHKVVLELRCTPKS